MRRFKGGSLGNQSIQHGEAVYIFPEVCSILANIRDECFGNETLGVMAVSWPSILQSYGNSVDLLSKDTKTLQLLMLDDNLRIMDVSDTSELFGIIVPRKSSKNKSGGSTSESNASDAISDEPEEDDSDIGMTSVPKVEGEEEVDDGPTLVTPGETIKWYEQMVYHQVLIDKSYAAANIEISPTNPEAELLLFFNYKYKPLPDHYELMMPLNKIVESGMATLVNGTYDIFLGKF